MLVTEVELQNALDGMRLSANMALRIGKFCGNGARVWLAMQTAYDLWLAERDPTTKDALRRIQTRK